MPNNAAIYARSSPDCCMSAEDQIETLKAVAAAQGWVIAKTFTDRPSPIRSGREPRPGKQRC